MMQEKDYNKIRDEFRVRQGRQFMAIGITLLLVLAVAAVYRRPDIFGEFSRNNLFGAQAIMIASFAGFSAYNWRCPSCKKYLGNDINRRGCRHCGTRLR